MSRHYSIARRNPNACAGVENHDECDGTLHYDSFRVDDFRDFFERLKQYGWQMAERRLGNYQFFIPNPDGSLECMLVFPEAFQGMMTHRELCEHIYEMAALRFQGQQEMADMEEYGRGMVASEERQMRGDPDGRMTATEVYASQYALLMRDRIDQEIMGFRPGYRMMQPTDTFLARTDEPHDIPAVVQAAVDPAQAAYENQNRAEGNSLAEERAVPKPKKKSWNEWLESTTALLKECEESHR